MHANDATLTLAPAAGAGLGKLLFDRLLADPELPKLLLDAVNCGLTAMQPRRWDKDSQQWITDPDARTRMQTVVMLLAQAEGEPVKRIIHQHIGAGKIDLGGALADSPELQAAMERELQKARWQHSGNQAHKRPRKTAAEVIVPEAPSQSQ